MLAHELRQRAVYTCILLLRWGYFAATGGNLAVRIDAETFAVTPSATDYLTMTAADICVVRLPDLECVDGERTPSVETGLHARVLRRRPDVHCSIHTHQPVASACALLGEALAVKEPELRRSLGARVPLIGYMPSGTGLLSFLVGRALRADVNAYLMRNHGALCCGNTIETAVQAVEDLERLSSEHLLGRISARAQASPQLAAALRNAAAALETSQ
jgi:L-fuculose-phosphate aldolase